MKPLVRGIIKYNIPLTYKPKIQAVIDGTCRQTIRVLSDPATLQFPSKQEKQPGDQIRFYTWEGRPYHSKRKTITGYFTVTEAIRIVIEAGGIRYNSPQMAATQMRGTDFSEWSEIDRLAELDGIFPATGIKLGKVLMSKNKIPELGATGQIIRW